MRFNPPPNWPQPPAGWAPPPDWEPDPSWPQPPFGWQLWIPEEEFVISPYRAAAARSQSTEPWHRRTVSVVLFLIFFFPVGLALLWLRTDWSVQRRGVITAVVGVFVIIVAATSSAPPTTTTALNPTTVAGTASPSHTPSPSHSAATTPAAPAPVVTKPRAPVTSAPPKTTAPVVVHTSAAPAYTPPTTQAPPPPPPPPPPAQTTAQTQGCSPLTNSGNCYSPGEYCRDDDHGVSGTDANGDPITCEDNDGWRWERT